MNFVIDLLIILGFIAAGAGLGALVAFPLGKRAERRKLGRHINIHHGGESASYTYGCSVNGKHKIVMMLRPVINKQSRTR